MNRSPDQLPRVKGRMRAAAIPSYSLKEECFLPSPNEAWYTSHLTLLWVISSSHRRRHWGTEWRNKSTGPTASTGHSWNVGTAKYSGSVLWIPQYPSPLPQTIIMNSLDVVAHAHNLELEKANTGRVMKTSDQPELISETLSQNDQASTPCWLSI